MESGQFEIEVLQHLDSRSMLLRNRILRCTIGILVIALPLLASGCFYSEPEYQPEIPLGDDTGEPSYTPYEPPPTDTIEPAPEPETPEPTPTNNPTIIDEQRPPDDVTWISPGKVVVGNFHAGGRAEYPITIHNGKDVTTEFAVYYRIPDHVPEDTTKAPNMVQDWVIVADPTPVLAPYETRDILVVLAMPQTAVDPAPKWEFWVGVKDNSQTGMVQTELCVRWIISMRGS